MIRRIFLIVSMIFFWRCSSVAQTSDQNQFKIISPLDMDTVLNNQLLIVVLLPLNHKTQYAEFRVILDDMFDFTEIIKIKGNNLTVLHDQRLKPGMHTLKIYGKIHGGIEYSVVANHFFRVIGDVKENKWLRKNKLAKTGEKERVFKLNGSIQLLSNDVWVNGPGADFRQEPSFTREAAVNLNIKLSKFEFPIQGLVTTNARGEFAYRNRMMIGCKFGRFSIYAGDRFVEEDRLVLSGLRIQGLAATVPLGKETTLLAISGKNVDEFLINNNFPLPNTQSSALFDDGLPRYQRNYLYFKLSSFYNKEINHTSISILKASDAYDRPLLEGLKPKDNIVFGFENFYSFFQKRSSIRINFATSMLTNDRSIPTESTTYEKIFNINSSTSPLNLKKLESLSLILNYKLNLTRYFSINLEGKRLGGSYSSLGNPYMMNNRLIFRASEKSIFILNKLFLNISYDYMKDNNNNAASITRENHSVSSSLALNISQKLPSLTIGFRNFLGNTYGLNTTANSKISSNNIFGSINYSLNLKDVVPQISFSRNDMNLISELMTDSRQQINDLTFSLSYKIKIGFDVQVTDIKQQMGDLNLPQQTQSFRTWYKIKKPDLKFSFRVMKNSLNYNGIGVQTRNTIQGGIDYAPIKKIMLNINAGTAPYRSYLIENNYNEQFVQIRLSVFL